MVVAVSPSDGRVCHYGDLLDMMLRQSVSACFSRAGFVEAWL